MRLHELCDGNELVKIQCMIVARAIIEESGHKSSVSSFSK